MQIDKKTKKYCHFCSKSHVAPCAEDNFLGQPLPSQTGTSQRWKVRLPRYKSRKQRKIGIKSPLSHPQMIINLNHHWMTIKSPWNHHETLINHSDSPSYPSSLGLGRLLQSYWKWPSRNTELPHQTWWFSVVWDNIPSDKLIFYFEKSHHFDEQRIVSMAMFNSYI